MWKIVGASKASVLYIYIDLDSLIFTINNLLGTKLKIKWDIWYKIKNQIKI